MKIWMNLIIATVRIHLIKGLKGKSIKILRDRTSQDPQDKVKV